VRTCNVLAEKCGVQVSTRKASTATQVRTCNALARKCGVQVCMHEASKQLIPQKRSFSSQSLVWRECLFVCLLASQVVNDHRQSRVTPCTRGLLTLFQKASQKVTCAAGRARAAFLFSVTVCRCDARCGDPCCSFVLNFMRGLRCHRTKESREGATACSFILLLNISIHTPCMTLSK
jgi:hypothetical protein